MPPLAALMMRIVAQTSRGEMTALRGRLLRFLVVLCVILGLAIVALALVLIAVAIALADRIGLVPALLSMAAVSTIAALGLALTIQPQRHRSKPPIPDLFNLAGRKLSHIDPMILVVSALVTGLFLGKRR